MTDHDCKNDGAIHDIKSDIAILEKRINRHDVEMAISENRIKSVESDLKAIRSDTRWLLRLVIGTIVVAVFAALINAAP